MTYRDSMEIIELKREIERLQAALRRIRQCTHKEEPAGKIARDVITGDGSGVALPPIDEEANPVRIAGPR